MECLEFFSMAVVIRIFFTNLSQHKLSKLKQSQTYRPSVAVAMLRVTAEVSIARMLL